MHTRTHNHTHPPTHTHSHSSTHPHTHTLTAVLRWVENTVKAYCIKTAYGVFITICTSACQDTHKGCSSIIPVKHSPMWAFSTGCLWAFVSVCACICACFCLSVCPSVPVFVCMHLHTLYTSFCVYVYIGRCVSVHLHALATTHTKKKKNTTIKSGLSTHCQLSYHSACAKGPTAAGTALSRLVRWLFR